MEYNRSFKIELITDKQNNKKHHEWVGKIVKIPSFSLDDDCNYLYMQDEYENVLRSSKLIHKTELDSRTVKFESLNSIFILYKSEEA